jgi:4-hydroxy 2-oxovalerate aldolase
MDKFNLLECTLRDGGYITGWHFDDDMIKDTIETLIDANLDFVEVGYLNNSANENNMTQFKNIDQIIPFLPKDRKDTVILAMADVLQFKPEDLTLYDGKSIDGIRVVFYKHQIEEALIMSKAIKNAGYKLFVQPMVTIDYTVDEYAGLAKEIAKLEPYAVSIVDSFGYMLKSDFRQYFKILDNILAPETVIGFHSHNNMNLAFITAQDILEYETSRRLVIDASLYGMGRGAGNLNTELIANYYNMTLGNKYDTIKILDLISKYIMPIRSKRQWGYSPYMFITGLYHYHPNFACYLLDEVDVPVSVFEKFIQTIPIEMRTKCRKPYVLDMWNKFCENNDVTGA